MRLRPELVIAIVLAVFTMIMVASTARSDPLPSLPGGLPECFNVDYWKDDLRAANAKYGTIDFFVDLKDPDMVAAFAEAVEKETGLPAEGDRFIAARLRYPDGSYSDKSTFAFFKWGCYMSDGRSSLQWVNKILSSSI